MSKPIVIARRAQGFSLLEVLVAFTILTLSLAVLLQIFSTGLRAAALTEAYAHATALAESKLAELGAVQPLTEGSEEGQFDDDYRWRVTVRTPPWWTGEATLVPMQPYEVTVQVRWGERNRERSVDFTTVRLVPVP